VIKRPVDLVEIEAELVFNSRPIDRIEVDLAHIIKNSRSNVTATEVWEIVVFNLSGATVMATDSKKYSDGSCDYFVRTIRYRTHWFKLVWCICNDRPTTLGIMTFYRI
jgi:hypothetical protein